MGGKVAVVPVVLYKLQMDVKKFKPIAIPSAVAQTASLHYPFRLTLNIMRGAKNRAGRKLPSAV